MYCKKIKTLFFLIVMIMNFHSPLCYADISLNFGLYSSDKASDMVRKFRPLLNVLEYKLSRSLSEPVKINIKVSSSYEKGISRLVNGEVDFARFGSASYILSKQRNPQITILVNEKNKTSQKISGVVAVKEGSNINSIADLSGKSFAFGNEHSTLGRYFAQNSLQENGIKAGDLSNYSYLGRHDRVAAAVFAGQYDAGSFKVKTLNKFAQQGKNFKVLSTYPVIYKVWLARENLDASIFNAIQFLLINLRDEDTLKNLKHAGFVLGVETDFELVKQVIEKNNLFFEK